MRISETLFFVYRFVIHQARVQNKDAKTSISKPLRFTVAYMRPKKTRSVAKQDDYVRCKSRITEQTTELSPSSVHHTRLQFQTGFEIQAHKHDPNYSNTIINMGEVSPRNKQYHLVFY